MGGQPLDVDELLQPSHLKREYRLRPLVFGLSKAELVQLTMVGALIAAGIIAWVQWQSHQDRIAKEAAFQAEQLRLAELARLQQESGVEQLPQALEHPWAKRPSVTDFIEGCSRGIYQSPLSIEGWLFTSVRLRWCKGLVNLTDARAIARPTSPTAHREAETAKAHRG